MSTNLESAEVLSPTKRALLALKQLQSKLEALERAKHEPIAITGIGCRFPHSADHPKAFWQLLHDGVDAITEVPKDRWDIDAYYDSDPDAPGKMSTRYGGFISQLHEFDAQFFRISPREAMSLDPQQRLLMEVSWEALENSGVTTEQLTGSQTGVFVGICGNDHWHQLLSRKTSEIDAYLATGNAHSMASGRLSYILGCTGPSLSVDTACSSSLVAVHLACQSLRNQECDLALAGGVNRILLPEVSVNFSKARMLSPDGRCKTFDTAANGFVRGEGCGVIVLKRLSDAVAANDNILALICGSAVNHDSRTSGLTVPNGPSQQAVIRQALNNGQIEPARVTYVETHGTGTALGDPIEVGALGAVFGKERSFAQPLLIGSVKTNIGHLEAAAGVAGLVKVVLALQHEEIPPHLHFQNPNPHISWDELPVKVPTQRIPWLRGEKQRLAGVSSFGFSGTNAHVVLAEAPQRQAAQGDTPSAARPWHVLTLSAKSEKALQALAQRYAEFLVSSRGVSLPDVCFTANTKRSHFNHRLAIVTSSTLELHEQLTTFIAGQKAAGVLQGRVKDTTQDKIAFLFTGDSQHVGIGRQLYETQPSFRATLDHCAEILRHYLETPLLEILYPLCPPPSSASVQPTAYTQSALFALGYALYQLWKSWGIQPATVTGYGIGACVAACVAGVFNLEDGLKLVTAWEQEHLEAVTQELTYAKPQIPFISPVTGEVTANVETPEYWYRQVRQSTVSVDLKSLYKSGYKVFVEIGPQPLLSATERQFPNGSGVWLPSLSSAGDWQQILQSLAQLHVQGVSVDWSGFDQDYRRCQILLPTYPFQRQRYLVEGA